MTKAHKIAQMKTKNKRLEYSISRSHYTPQIFIFYRLQLESKTRLCVQFSITTSGFSSITVFPHDMTLLNLGDLLTHTTYVTTSSAQAEVLSVCPTQHITIRCPNRVT